MAGRRRKSRKRCDANSVGKLPDSPIFFIDRALGCKHVPEILKAHGFEVRIHDDYFLENASDIEWLTEAGKRGWVILSKDKLIRKRPLELKILLDAGVAAFILTSGNLTAREMGEVFVRARSRMLKLLAKQKRPFIAAVTRGGQVELYRAG
jgi:predicted nuclease of predicted toxin-antitoxin system